MDYEAHISFLNSSVVARIAPSPIHGVGVVAIRDIAKGQRLYADRAPFVYRISKGNLGKLLPEVRSVLAERWPAMELGNPFVFPDVNFQGYMNHSDDPNYCNKTDTALRDIRKGEEITEDYRNIDGWKVAFPWLDTPKPKKRVV